MKAVIEMNDGNVIEVLGGDLSISCGVIPPQIYVEDVAADGKQIFYASPDKVKCAYIWGDINAVIERYKEGKE